MPAIHGTIFYFVMEAQRKSYYYLLLPLPPHQPSLFAVAAASASTAHSVPETSNNKNNKNSSSNLIERTLAQVCAFIHTYIPTYKYIRVSGKPHSSIKKNKV